MSLPKNVSAETMQLITPAQTYEYTVERNHDFAEMADSARWAQMRSQVMHLAVLDGQTNTKGWEFQLVVTS